MEDFEDLYLEYLEQEEQERIEKYLDDPYFDRAEREIKKLFVENPKEVFYTKQIQVFFEKKFFHWLTYRVLNYLNDMQEIKKLKENSIIFYTHKSNRYPKREVKKKSKIIKEFSQSNIAKSCGNLAEHLFGLAFARKGYNIIATETNEFNRKKWEKTNHNLDFIFEKDGIFYGCEIKNSLSYIERDELNIKIEMCKYLNIHSLFILRHAPKTYIEITRKNGGITLIFEKQIYDISQEKLVKNIINELKLPVMCSSNIPEGIMNRMEKMHNKIVNSKKIHKNQIINNKKSTT